MSDVEVEVYIVVNLEIKDVNNKKFIVKIQCKEIKLEKI